MKTESPKKWYIMNNVIFMGYITDEVALGRCRWGCLEWIRSTQPSFFSVSRCVNKKYTLPSRNKSLSNFSHTEV